MRSWRKRSYRHPCTRYVRARGGGTCVCRHMLWPGRQACVRRRACGTPTPPDLPASHPRRPNSQRAQLGCQRAFLPSPLTAGQPRGVGQRVQRGAVGRPGRHGGCPARCLPAGQRGQRAQAQVGVSSQQGAALVGHGGGAAIARLPAACTHLHVHCPLPPSCAQVGEHDSRQHAGAEAEHSAGEGQGRVGRRQQAQARGSAR